METGKKNTLHNPSALSPPRPFNAHKLFDVLSGQIHFKEISLLNTSNLCRIQLKAFCYETTLHLISLILFDLQDDFLNIYICFKYLVSSLPNYLN